MITAFQEGGWFMWVVLATAMVAIATAATALVMALGSATRQPALSIGLFALGFAVFVPAMGAVGYQLAIRDAMTVLALVDPSQRARLLDQASSEAMNLVVFGVLAGALPLVLALAAVARAWTRPTLSANAG